MKGLVLRLWFLLLFGVVHGNLIEMPLPHEGRDEKIVQNFLLFHAFLEAEGENNSISFSPELENPSSLKGTSGELHHFLPFFKRAIRAMIQGDSKNLADSKEKFLERLDIFERGLAEEIDLQRVLEVAPTLTSLLSLQSPCQPFYNLPLSGEDQSNISKIIKNMGDLGWIGLLKEKKSMEKIGDKVARVHPLRFLGHILTHPDLKKRLPKIMKDPLKQRSFLNGHGQRTGFGQRMSKEMHHGNMMQYVPGFAHAVGVSESQIIDCFYNHDWKRLINILM